MEETEFLTVAEVALRLRLSKATLSRMIADGELPAYEFRSGFRIKAAELEAYIAAQSTQNKEAVAT